MTRYCENNTSYPFTEIDSLTYQKNLILLTRLTLWFGLFFVLLGGLSLVSRIFYITSLKELTVNVGIADTWTAMIFCIGGVIVLYLRISASYKKTIVWIFSALIIFAISFYFLSGKDALFIGNGFDFKNNIVSIFWGCSAISVAYSTVMYSSFKKARYKVPQFFHLFILFSSLLLLVGNNLSLLGLQNIFSGVNDSLSTTALIYALNFAFLILRPIEGIIGKIVVKNRKDLIWTIAFILIVPFTLLLIGYFLKIKKFDNETKLLFSLLLLALLAIGILLRHLIKRIIKVEINYGIAYTEFSQTNESFAPIVLRAADLGTWSYNFNTQILVWDPKMYEIFGIEFKELDKPHLKDFWMSRIHSSDIQVVRNVFNAAIEAENTFDVEYRILMKDGEIKRMRTIGEILYDDNRQPIQFAGICYEDTSAIDKEQKRLEQNERIKNMLRGKVAVI